MKLPNRDFCLIFLKAFTSGESIPNFQPTIQLCFWKKKVIAPGFWSITGIVALLGTGTDIDYITFHDCTVIVAYSQVNSVIPRFIVYVYRVLLS